MIVDGWFDWADRRPGPAHKVWSDENSIDGVVFHSAVGSLQGVYNVVMGPAQKSVTAVIGYDGFTVQFYPVTASPWANGSHTYNRRYLGFEFEGGADTPETVSEPLTPAQVATAIRILKDLADFKRVSASSFWQRPTTLIEHRELVATACPSGRIPWDAITAGLLPVPQTFNEVDAYKTLLDVGHFITQGWDLKDIAQWQKRTWRQIGERMGALDS